MWTWDQSSGAMVRGGIIYRGYAGRDRGKNNPNMQSAKGIGPIPRGSWRMTSARDSLHTGAFTIVLEPSPETQTCGRGDFRIHGDSIAQPGTASHGCIILPRAQREAIWRSGDRQLEVVA